MVSVAARPNELRRIYAELDIPLVRAYHSSVRHHACSLRRGSDASGLALQQEGHQVISIGILYTGRASIDCPSQRHFPNG